MVAVPGFTCISLTKDRMKARVPVNSLVPRYSLMSLAKAVIVSILSNVTLRRFRIVLASSSAASSFSFLSRSSLIRSAASAMSSLVVSTTCQILPSRSFTSSSSFLMVFNLLRWSLASPSISSSTIFTRSLMLDSVRMFSLIFLTISPSKCFALSLGVWQVRLPCISRDRQT